MKEMGKSGQIEYLYYILFTETFIFMYVKLGVCDIEKKWYLDIF